MMMRLVMLKHDDGDAGVDDADNDDEAVGVD